jgi:hypothetical protein
MKIKKFSIQKLKMGSLDFFQPPPPGYLAAGSVETNRK